MVHQREVGVRPLVELEATDHPLAVEQRDGIDEDRMKDVVIGLLHESGQPGAAPNGGSATQLGDSGVKDGPPSVS